MNSCVVEQETKGGGWRTGDHEIGRTGNQDIWKTQEIRISGKQEN
jgi:hypothetical protein